MFRRTYSIAGNRPCIYIPTDLESYLDWSIGDDIELVPLQDEDGFKVIHREDEEGDA